MNTLNESIQDNETLLLTLLDTAARLERRLGGVLSDTRGISFTEYHLLLKLANMREGGATRVELAAAVGLTPSAVTRALKPLEKRGCVITRKNERDARRSLASLTPAGLELLADSQKVVQSEIKLLPLESVDHAQLFQLFDKLNKK
ncbi:MAG: MarR family transcriptional regulator [Pseudomonadota bacterium]